MDVTLRREMLLLDEGPFPEREHSGFSEGTRAPCPHCPSHPRARGVAACAITGCGTWRGRKCSCTWKRRQVATVCLVSRYQGTSNPVTSVTNMLFYETWFFFWELWCNTSFSSMGKITSPNIFLCAVTHFVAPCFSYFSSATR